MVKSSPSPWSMEKVSSVKLVPEGKKVGNCSPKYYNTTIPTGGAERE